MLMVFMREDGFNGMKTDRNVKKVFIGKKKRMVLGISGMREVIKYLKAITKMEN